MQKLHQLVKHQQLSYNAFQKSSKGNWCCKAIATKRYDTIVHRCGVKILTFEPQIAQIQFTKICHLLKPTFFFGMTVYTKK